MNRLKDARFRVRGSGTKGSITITPEELSDFDEGVIDTIRMWSRMYKVYGGMGFNDHDPVKMIWHNHKFIKGNE